MEQIAKLIDFLESYPSWLKYLVVGLIFTIVVLLIVFRPSKEVGLPQWKLRVYDFRTFGNLASKQSVGERLSGRILDDLIRRQLNAQAGTERPPTAIVPMRAPNPPDVMEAYRKLAPFVEVSGHIEDDKSGNFDLYLRVTRIDEDLNLRNLLTRTYKVSQDESNWETVSRSIGEEIFELLSAMPQQKALVH